MFCYPAEIIIKHNGLLIIITIIIIIIIIIINYSNGTDTTFLGVKLDANIVAV